LKRIALGLPRVAAGRIPMALLLASMTAMAIAEITTLRRPRPLTANAMALALSAHVMLLAIAIMRRNGGQGIAAGLLLGNWITCSAFVYFSGVDFPWIWYLTIDWLTAVIFWIDHELGWQRWLIASYGVELLLHAAFAYVTRNVDPLIWSRTSLSLYWTQRHYHDGLAIFAWAQMALVGSWIAHDLVRDYCRANGRGAFVRLGNKGQAS
jgi:hypothetical protein